MTPDRHKEEHFSLKLEFRPPADRTQIPPTGLNVVDGSLSPSFPLIATYRFVVGATCASVWSCEYLAGLRAVALATGPIERSRCVIQVIIHYIVVFLRCHYPVIIITIVAEKIATPYHLGIRFQFPRDNKIVNQENKNSADIITWREYEALRNEMRREFALRMMSLRTMMKILSLKMTHTMLVVRLVVIVRVGFHLAAMVVDKMKKMDWLKIEKLWSLHPNYFEDKKIKLASSEFDGYALRWWDSLVRNREEDGAQPIRTWRAMKEVMTSRFVPTNYLRNIFDKIALLRQGVKTVDEYYMEMEMLMQRGRVSESVEMTMQRFLNGLKYDVKGIIRHYTYTNMNQLLHHAREVNHLVKKQRLRDVLQSGRLHPCPLPAPSSAPPYSTPPSKPVSNVSNAKKSESARIDVFPEEVPAGLPPLREILVTKYSWTKSTPRFLFCPKHPTPESRRGALVGQMTWWRAQPGRATLWSRRLVDPPAPPLRLYKAPASKTLTEEATIRESSRAAAIAAKIGDKSLCSAPAQRCPEGFSIDTAAISTAIFITAPMRRSSSPSRLVAVPIAKLTIAMIILM
ncbi:hypothetical protein QYE76_022073 [Lolium multiflorum]|uniref:Retrotransposon gag domain-containing protein n=1 Tax=Lolium multiflorum TaxID=4521 RepID=A0AAD8R9J6_LOLMU|nr:hypothetical protein QYE76_022073 [Lolium multiflorum]